MWFPTSTRKVQKRVKSDDTIQRILLLGHSQATHQVKDFLNLGFLTSYFIWRRFSLVTVGRASLPYLVRYRHCWKQLRCKINTQRLTKEYTILWFEFDLCGLRHQQDTTDPTLDNDTSSERTFQRLEQVRVNRTIACNWLYSEDHALDIVFTRQKARAGANP